MLPRYGWRAVFFVGILPALFTLWVRAHVREPGVWIAARASRPRSAWRELAGPMLPLTLLVTAMNACTMFAWWGFNLWIPSYLNLPVPQGGVGLPTETMAMFVVVMQVGMWLGYVTFGFASDHFGRKRSYVTFLLLAAVLMASYATVRQPVVLLLLGPLVAFFGTGYFSGFGAVTAEIYPTAIRATAQGLTYNAGRVVSALAPFVVGSIAQTAGLRRRVRDRRRGVPDGGAVLDVDPGNAGPGPAGLSPGAPAVTPSREPLAYRPRSVA